MHKFPLHVKKTSNTMFTNFVEIYFQVTYYLCYSPFSLINNPTTGKFVLHHNKLQKTLCIFFNMLGFLCKVEQYQWDVNRIHNFQNITSESEPNNPVSYLALLSSIFGTAYRIKTLHQFWFRRTDFVDFVNGLQNAHNFIKLKRKHWIKIIFNKVLLLVLLITYVLVSLVPILYKKYTTVGLVYLNKLSFLDLTFETLLWMGRTYM